MPALLFAALHDVLTRTIPNALCGIVALLGCLIQLLHGHLLLAFVNAGFVLALALLCWARGWMGGGDVKLLAAGTLTFPVHSLSLLQQPHLILRYLFFVSAAGGVLALLYLALRLFVPPPQKARPKRFAARWLRAEQWRIRRGAPLPYGVAISAGAFAMMIIVG